MKRQPLPREFYFQDTVLTARALLGCILWRREGKKFLSGRIVETEAYLGANDPASHARRGLRSPRNESMYLDGGHAYVYFTYGMYFCMNVVTQEAGVAEAVLIRALQPIDGAEVMRSRRAAARTEFDIANGPGKLCQALAIDRALDGASLAGPTLFLTARETDVAEDDIAVTPRIGIDGSGDAAHWPLRFFLAGNRHVSMNRRSR